MIIKSKGVQKGVVSNHLKIKDSAYIPLDFGSSRVSTVLCALRLSPCQKRGLNETPIVHRIRDSPPWVVNLED